MLDQLLAENRQLRLAIAQAKLIDRQAIARGSLAKLNSLRKEYDEASHAHNRNKVSQEAAELAVKEIENEI